MSCIRDVVSTASMIAAPFAGAADKFDGVTTITMAPATRLVMKSDRIFIPPSICEQCGGTTLAALR
jgi:hypothetical protein